MKKIAQKVVVVVAVVFGMSLGSGAMDVSAANPQSVKHLKTFDGSETLAVTVRYAPAAETVHQSRYGIGLTADV